MTIDTSTPPFAFLGGDPSLDLVNTVAWTRHGLAHERLTTYDAVTQWAEGAGVIAGSVGATLRRRAKFRSHEAEETLTKAWEIRAILQRLFAPAAAAKDRESPLAAYNALLGEALQRLEVGRGERQGFKVAPARMRWSWREIGDSLDSLLWPVVWSAALLLVSEEAARIRKCGGQDCGWVYVDRSRNGLRRWCRMETCGTQAKSRRRRERRPLGAGHASRPHGK
jgi:predicted RNA-binding Zn ribbon-like protein